MKKLLTLLCLSFALNASAGICSKASRCPKQQPPHHTTFLNEDKDLLVSTLADFAIEGAGGTINKNDLFNCCEELIKDPEFQKQLVLRAKKMNQDGIVQLTSANVQPILNTNEYVIVDVYTDWCGPCKYMAPIFEELNTQYGHLYAFAKLNAEEQRSLTQSYGIRGYPTILFIKNGNVIGKEVGLMNKDKLTSKIKQHFAN